MVGTVDVLAHDSSIKGVVKSLPEDFNPTVFIQDFVPPIVVENAICNEITEPDVDDEVAGEREAYVENVLAGYVRSLTERTKNHLGYPIILDFDYVALSQFQNFPINNLGDPFIESDYGVHSRQFEVGVLNWFARLWELEKDEYSGYITNCGTEGNLHGILVGRGLARWNFICPQESHYSVFKAAHIYRMECVKIKTLCSGEIDCEDFKAMLLCHKDKPAIVNVNIGKFLLLCFFTLHALSSHLFLIQALTLKLKTAGKTVKGAVDDIDLLINKLEEAGYSHDKFYIHCDAALFGLMLPFVKHFKQERIQRFSERSAKVFEECTLLQRSPCDAGIGAMLHELSNIVVFEGPHDEEFVHKWQLACQGNIARVVIMPNVTIEKLHDFLNELVQRRAVWLRDAKSQPYCLASAVGHKNCLCALHR
ncbi:hypothetical protein RJT34_04096 [Clitoria ternatea]|uniref:Histidine decarboxylase n=1 Tax=Clitoria ternatea TaxID=43366 RepID=A0AAN9KK96_CLITE